MVEAHVDPSAGPRLAVEAVVHVRPDLAGLADRWLALPVAVVELSFRKRRLSERAPGLRSQKTISSCLNLLKSVAELYLCESITASRNCLVLNCRSFRRRWPIPLTPRWP